MNVIECIQGDSTWFESRLGMLTGSRIADALSKLKNGGESATRRNMMIDLAIERITGKPTEHYVSEPMQRGLDLEPLALAAYELRTESEVERVGFVLHPRIQWAGCSPDGLVGAGLVQAKCPLPRTHANYLLAGCVPQEYVPQMMWELACTEKPWSDFISFCPEFPSPLDLLVCRLERDDAKIAEMEADAVKFLKDVEVTVTQLREGLEGVLKMSAAK